ncbi:hypothetical protein [uncultured Senegalimassilia sp.]|uniref:hypothetical protein n=1 Tax=uncultured Senegalimassilia sp. TaxID=1714350 RepID=UPI0025FA196C|nr:hypothetical protein [uncultured Senegalimassilia sp.]
MSTGSRTTKYRFAQVGAVFALLVLAAVLVAATYAWFTNNTKVNTDSVSVRSGDSKLVVELGDASAGGWSSEGDVAFSSNSPSPLTLYPVSTFDLEGFAECSRTDEQGRAVSFKQAEDGQHFYHGWVDMRASITGSGASMASGVVNLYLGDTLAPEGADPELLKATRVGLKLSRDGQVLQSRYFTLDDSAGSHRSEHPVTAPSLPGYSDGMLLGWQNGALACANDDTQDYTAYLMGADESAARPQNALLAMDLGQTYRLDVYYYIEGTDQDSADYLYNDAGILHVNLFAVLDGQGV